MVYRSAQPGACTLAVALLLLAGCGEPETAPRGVAHELPSLDSVTEARDFVAGRWLTFRELIEEAEDPGTFDAPAGSEASDALARWSAMRAAFDDEYLEFGRRGLDAKAWEQRGPSIIKARESIEYWRARAYQALGRDVAETVKDPGALR